MNTKVYRGLLSKKSLYDTISQNKSINRKIIFLIKREEEVDESRKR